MPLIPAQIKFSHQSIQLLDELAKMTGYNRSTLIRRFVDEGAMALKKKLDIIREREVAIELANSELQKRKSS